VTRAALQLLPPSREACSAMVVVAPSNSFQAR